MSDDDNQMLQMDFAVEPHKTWMTLEDEDMDRIERLALELRERPLMPPMPGDGTRHWPECTSGIAFPSYHCAMRNCSWTSAHMPCFLDRSVSNFVSQEGHWRLLQVSERIQNEGIGCCNLSTCLRQHLADAHSDVIDTACGRDTREKHYSFYLEAIAHKEQQTMPMVGASIDRRTFGHVAANLTEASVRSMVCMCCARVFLSNNGTTNIALVRSVDYFNAINSTSWEMNWCFYYVVPTDQGNKTSLK